MTDAKLDLQVPKILWAAFLVSHLLFVGIGTFIHGTAEPAGEELELFTYILTGVGVVTALASGLAVPLFLAKTNFFTAVIIRFAFAESTTIYGLVLAMMGADLQWLYILAGLGVVAHVTAFPSERERDAHAARRGSAGSG